ncbi:uroporphyrinogen decarboxylase [Deferribacterales bacterium RsTz2092]|nr:uroporphyrinogen decarboxylase [Deferribacterales bacterium]
MAKYNDLLLRMLEGGSCERPPIWLMRQAGRYLSEYRELRSKHTFLEMCKSPALAAEATRQPVARLGVDAAILFSDILVPVEAMGAKLSFNPAPVIHNPIRTSTDVDNLNVPEMKSSVAFVYETIKDLTRTLNVPLIGFSGAPFTLASYLVEGGGSKDFLQLKRLMHSMPKVYGALMEKLTVATYNYLQVQVDAGCPVVQLFDTWAGVLSPAEYCEYVLPYVAELTNSIKGAHIIYFAKGASSFFNAFRSLKCSAIGVDWGVSLTQANELLDGKFCLQGNLDPAMLFTDKETITKLAKSIVDEGRRLPAHIFNLGHGIMPQTPVENVKLLVDIVTEHA